MKTIYRAICHRFTLCGSERLHPQEAANRLAEARLREGGSLRNLG